MAAMHCINFIYDRERVSENGNKKNVTHRNENDENQHGIITKNEMKARE